MATEIQEEGREETTRWGVLLLAHGAPGRVEDIPAFLLRVTNGRRPPDAMVSEVVRRYKLIGGSPLLRITTLQAQGLAKQAGHPVYVGMRNWTPFISEAIRKIDADGVRRIAALSLAPHNSRTSIGLYKQHVSEAAARLAPGLQVDFIENWHNHPGFIAAYREKVVAALARVEADASGPVPVIFTAHSVPVKTIVEGDPYERQVRETAGLVADAAGLKEYDVAFQSRGMTAEPWIGPSVESCIDRLAGEGRRHVLLAPAGFVSDHVEILYDIDVAIRDYGKARGITVHRTESLNDSPLFIKALAAIVTAREEGKTQPEGTS